MRLLLLIFLITASVAARAGDQLAVRADRAFDSGEWAQAQAMYGVLSSRPQAPAKPYARAIVAAYMLGDTTAVHTMADNAISAAVPLDSLLKHVETDSYNLRNGDIYPALLQDMAARMPYMRRAMLLRMLNYYVYRADAPNTIECVNQLLAGLPDDVRFLSILADAQFKTGDTDGAVATCTRILELDPTNYEALLAMANHYDGSGRPREALDYFRRADSIRATPYVTNRIAALNTSN